MTKYRIGDRVFWEGVDHATIVDIDEFTTAPPTYYLAYYKDDKLHKASVLETQICLKPTVKDIKSEARLVYRCCDDDRIFSYRGEYYVLNNYNELLLLDGDGSIIDE